MNGRKLGKLRRTLCDERAAISRFWGAYPSADTPIRSWETRMQNHSDASSAGQTRPIPPAILPGDGAPLDDHDRARLMLAAKHGITADFVRVGTLARIMGMAPATIYTAMRQGRFCIPHRMVGAAPLVKLDDLVEWYCQAPEPEAKPQAEAAERARARMEREKINAEQMVAEVFTEMGIARAPRSRRRPH